MDATPDLELYDGEVGTVLGIVAHPDDLEYGAAAAIARWTASGHPVAYLLVTRGEAGIDGIPPDRCGPLREQEQRESARIVGVEQVEFLSRPDGLIVHDIELRRDLAAAIRRHQPDTIVTLNHRADWGAPGSMNSADHRAVGAAILDAVADASNRWIFPGVGGDPHQVKRVMVANSPLATRAVDVSGNVDAAVASLAAHRAYLDGLGEHPMSDPEFVRWMLEQTGGRAGVDAALAVELFEF